MTLASLALLGLAATAHAEPTALAGWRASSVAEALGYSALFGLTGILMVAAGFKLFDKIITRVDFEEEIKKGNVAAAIVAGAAIIGLSLIIAASMS